MPLTSVGSIWSLSLLVMMMQNEAPLCTGSFEPLFFRTEALDSFDAIRFLPSNPLPPCLRSHHYRLSVHAELLCCCPGTLGVLCADARLAATATSSASHREANHAARLQSQ